MQFKHPEVLYALFLLLIPIIIHLFQLRRFQKVDFTNVAYLKKATLQTRKSALLKKWLTLLARLLALACIILAFAQPYTTNRDALGAPDQVVLYVDNSFSMQAKGPNGSLLERAAQDLYGQLAGLGEISWFTNNSTWKNRSLADVKSELLQLRPTYQQLTWQEVLLTANQLFGDSKTPGRKLIIVSDFQQREGFPDLPDGMDVTAVAPRPISEANVSIDSAYITSKNASQFQLNVLVSARRPLQENIPISLFRNDELVAKTAIDFSGKLQQSISFQIEKGTDFEGKLSLPDSNMPFDNELFFSLNTPEPIKVLSINNAESAYLDKLFEGPEFRYTQQDHTAIDYNSLASQNLIILNELERLPNSLLAALGAFVNGGGSLFVIPAPTAAVAEYNTLLSQFSVGTIDAWNPNELQITEIVFGHPLFEGVFEKNVTNFQYPKVQGSFRGNFYGSPVLRYEDGTPFLLQNKSVYVTTAAWNSENSNFKNSPLIVPTLYNMAQQSLQLPVLYYSVGAANTFDVPLALGQDEIIALQKEGTKIIPLQQAKATHVSITTGTMLTDAGIYTLRKDEAAHQAVAFNYPRQEGTLQYQDPAQWEGISVQNSIENALEEVYDDNAIHSYWKWFVIFALVFLLSEMLLLKFIS